MAIDAPAEMATPSPPPPSSQHHSSPGRHFYVAVDRLQFKMETLVDLLGVAGRRPWLPIVLCCSSRDELDAVCATLSNLSCISLSYLYSDLAEVERALVLERFRQASSEWSHVSAHPEETDGSGGQAQSHIMVVTDACLPMVASGEAPIHARVLINFEIPAKKETYVRRMSTCLAADGIVINMVVGGEVVVLKALEESSGLVIAEMPINVPPALFANTKLFLLELHPDEIMESKDHRCNPSEDYSLPVEDNGSCITNELNSSKMHSPCQCRSVHHA